MHALSVSAANAGRWASARRLLLGRLREHDMRRLADGGVLDGPVSSAGRSRPEQRLAPTQRYWSDREMDLVYITSLDELPDNGDASADLDVRGSSRLACLRQCLLDAAGDEVERSTGLHCDRRSRIMGEYEGGRVVAPLSLQLVIGLVGPNMFRPRMNAPKPAIACPVNKSSGPVSPLTLPCIRRKVRVGKNYLNISSPRVRTVQVAGPEFGVLN